MTDEDVRRTMLRALRLLAILAVAGVALVWWKMGWQSAVLLAVGARDFGERVVGVDCG